MLTLIKSSFWKFKQLPSSTNFHFPISSSAKTPRISAPNAKEKSPSLTSAESSALQDPTNISILMEEKHVANVLTK